MRKKINLGIILSTILIISYYSLKPGNAVDPGTGSIFPVLHLFAYLGLSGSFLLYFHERDNKVFKAIISAFLFGLLMELLQTQIPGRFFTYKDLAINFLGASTVILDHGLDLSTLMVEYEDTIIEKLGNWQSI